jgi:hypothetical protein
VGAWCEATGSAGSHSGRTDSAESGGAGTASAEAGGADLAPALRSTFVDLAGERHGRVVRRCFVVEVKADLDDADVVAKHQAAVRWAARVNADGVAAPDEWHVLLASESALRDARGSWPQLLQRGRTDLG